MLEKVRPSEDYRIVLKFSFSSEKKLLSFLNPEVYDVEERIDDNAVISNIFLRRR